MGGSRGQFSKFIWEFWNIVCGVHDYVGLLLASSNIAESIVTTGPARTPSGLLTCSNRFEKVRKPLFFSFKDHTSQERHHQDLGGGGGGGECIVSLLWNTVRFPMLSNTFLTNVVKKSHHWHNISQVVCQFQQEHHLAAADRLINRYPHYKFYFSLILEALYKMHLQPNFTLLLDARNWP